MDDAINVITNPYADTDLAKGVLDEMEALLYRRGCMLVHTADATVLARITGNAEAAHIAKIYEITPGRIQAKLAWRDLIDKVVKH